MRDGDRPLALGGRKQRTLLAILLLHANEVVSSDTLIDGLWGEHAPKTAGTALQVYVSNLRKLLSPERLETRTPGYLLHVEPEELDIARFEGLVAGANRDPESSAARLEEALTLWHGRPLADFAYDPFARGEVARLEERRLTAIEQRIDAELELGRHAELVGELEALVAEHPYRERLRAQLMLALYRSGRQTEALAAYQDARRALVEELGVEPGTALQDLQGAILRQEPALAPPLETARTSRLPSQPTPFLGRTRERTEIVALLQRSDLRLLTLTGAGGSGKTRLALRAASELAPDYPHGVFWVPLSSLRDPALVPASIAQALSIQDEAELAAGIGERRLLLLLDNFEHLLAAAPALAELLAACPNLNLLATSREPLHLAGEREYLVPALADEEAVELFRQRAHASEPEQAVLAICQRLDCLPLAVELAAARTKLLPPEALLERLERRLPLLTGGPRDAPERQRTLEATIAWSYDLLNESERRLFVHLAVFAGGCTLAAAEEVCEADLDTLQSLIDKHLLRREGERFDMLETIREYATGQLAQSGEEDEYEQRHARHFLERAGELFDQRSYSEADPDQRHAASAWFAAERENLRAVYRRASDFVGRLQPQEQAAVLEELANVAYIAGELDHAFAAIENARRIYARLGDQEAVGRCVRILSRFHWFAGDGEAARSAAREAIAILEPLGESVELARAQSALSQLALLAEDADQAIAWGKDALGLATRLGDESTRAHALVNIGTARNQRDYRDVATLLEAHEIADAAGDWHEATRALANLSYTLMLWVRAEDALLYAEQALAYAQRYEMQTFEPYVAMTIAWLKLRAGEWDEAERVARAEVEKRGSVVELLAKTLLTELAVRRGDPDAEEQLADLGAQAERTGELQRIVPVLELKAEWALTVGGPMPTSEYRHVLDRVPERGWLPVRAAAWAVLAGNDVELAAADGPYAAMVRGDWAGAAAAFGEAGWEYDRALMLSLRDDEASLSEAIEVTRRLGAHPLTRRLAGRMRDLRFRVPAGPRETTRANPAGLTARQLEVLALLGDGLTNAEIAERLVVSQRTAEHHVAAVLTKLGASSRQEAAERAVQLHLVT